MFRIVRIQGRSMEPYLADGDFVLICRSISRLSIGDIIVCQHSFYPRLIKKITAINERGEVLLTGFNPEGISTEQMGWISVGQIEGKVIWKIRASK